MIKLLSDLRIFPNIFYLVLSTLDIVGYPGGDISIGRVPYIETRWGDGYEKMGSSLFSISHSIRFFPWMCWGIKRDKDEVSEMRRLL
jgi:hypothetical protein